MRASVHKVNYPQRGKGRRGDLAVLWRPPIERQPHIAVPKEEIRSQVGCPSDSQERGVRVATGERVNVVLMQLILPRTERGREAFT